MPPKDILSQNPDSAVTKIAGATKEFTTQTPTKFRDAIVKIGTSASLSYTEAGQVIDSTDNFFKENRGKFQETVWVGGYYRYSWFDGRIPFFSREQVEDADYTSAFERILRLAEIKKVLDNFRGRVRAEPSIIDGEYKGAGDPVYKFVTGSDKDRFKYDFETGDIRETYHNSSVSYLLETEKRRAAKLKQKISQFQNLEDTSFADHYWIQLTPKANHEIAEDQEGKVYINARIGDYAGQTHVIKIFEALAGYFDRRPDLLTGLKVYDYDERLALLRFFRASAADVIADDLNRCDKIVAYFDMAKKEEVFKFFQEFYGNTYEPFWVFDYPTPKFSEALNVWGNWGPKMEGIAFAQESGKEVEGRRRSHNDLLALALKKAAQKTGVEFMDSEEFEKNLREQFLEFGIDPDNPAYNLKPKERFGPERVPGDPTLYDEYKKRVEDLKKKQV